MGISIFIISLAITFCVGIVCGIFSTILVKQHKYPIVSIVLSIISWFGLCIPINFTLGFMAGKLAMIIVGIYVVLVIIKNVRNMREN